MENQPVIFLPTGSHTMRGEFAWDMLPESLQLDPRLGIVRLTLSGAAVPFPDLRDGRLWLKGAMGSGAAEEDRMEVQVNRRVIDEIPLRVVTRVEIDVAGRQREESLGPVLLGGQAGSRFIPLEIAGPITARRQVGTLNSPA